MKGVKQPKEDKFGYQSVVMGIDKSVVLPRGQLLGNACVDCVEDYDGC